MQFRDLVKKMLEPVERRVLLMVSRCIVESVNKDKKIQQLKLQILKGELAENVELYQHYGFTSAPPKGSDALTVFIGGDRNSGVVIATESRKFRFKTSANGEVALYTDEGDYIHFMRGNKIKIKAATEVIIDTPLTSLSGNLDVAGDICSQGNIDAALDITAGGNVEAGVNVEAAVDVSAGGNVAAAGSLSDATGSMSATRSQYNAHSHPPDTAAAADPQMT